MGAKALSTTFIHLLLPPRYKLSYQNATRSSQGLYFAFLQFPVTHFTIRNSSEC